MDFCLVIVTSEENNQKIMSTFLREKLFLSCLKIIIFSIKIKIIALINLRFQENLELSRM